MTKYAYCCTNCKTFTLEESGKIVKCEKCGEEMTETKIDQIHFQCLGKYEKEHLANETISHREKLTKDMEENRREAEEMARLMEERRVLEEYAKNIAVTTCDLKCDYDIIGPVYYQLNDAGIGSMFNNLVKRYEERIEEWSANGQRTGDRGGIILETLGAAVNIMAIIGGTWQDRDLLGNSHRRFDLAFFIAVEELKIRAAMLGADAIIGMRQDIDLDTNGFQHFYLQMYGTAVKTRK